MRLCKLACLGLALLLLTWGIAGCAKSDGGGTPPPPVTLSASPASIDFGSIAVGSSQTQTVTLTSTGSVSVTSASLSGSSAFSMTGLTPPVTVSPSSSVTFSVTFAPQAAGAANATITISSGAGTLTISLTGTGSAPATPFLSVSPAAVGFGSVIVGTTNSQSASMKAMNGPLTVNSASISDSQVTLTGIAFPLSLAANQTANYMVVYHPTIANSNFGATITFNTTGSPNTTTQTVTAAATSPPPAFLVAPASLDFGTVTVGTNTTQTQSIQGANATITLQSVGVSGPYTVTGIVLPQTLQPNITISYNVTFSPTSVGSQPGNITFLSTAANSPTNITLSGNAVSLPTLTVSPTTMSFGSIAVGQTASQAGSVSAAGGNITITSVTPSDPQVTVTGFTFPQTVNNNTSMPFTVTYKPTVAGTFNATIAFNITTSPFTVNENVTASPYNPIPHNVVLTWTASASAVVGYNVYRGTQSGGPYTKQNLSLVGSTTFTDFSVVSGTTYFYVVTAVDNLNHESSLSNEAKAVIPIP